jgi:hypothetical protein
MSEGPNEIDYRSAMVVVDGKLRGSRARGLVATVERLADDGYDQLVLDLRGCPSIDSLGALALRRALELGQRLFLVLGQGFRLEEFLPADMIAHPRLYAFTRSEDAVFAARARDKSGILVA